LTTAGSTIIFFLAPLGADLSHVADALSEELEMDLFASSFSLINTALASAGVVGPLFIGWLQDEVGWTGTCTAMGILCVSGAVPCVSAFYGMCILRLIFLPGSLHWQAVAYRKPQARAMTRRTRSYPGISHIARQNESTIHAFHRVNSPRVTPHRARLW
jgi:MFS family permease